MQGVAKKLKNWGEFVAKKLIKQDKQELNNCVCYNRGILRLWLRWWLKIRDLRNKVNSLSHVLDQTSTILSSRNLPRCVSGLQRNTQNCTGVMGNVFLNDHMLKKDNPPQSSTIQWIWHLHSSQNMRPDISETARRDLKRESLDTPIQAPHF